jgi:hypothetical protein
LRENFWPEIKLSRKMFFHGKREKNVLEKKIAGKNATRWGKCLGYWKLHVKTMEQMGQFSSAEEFLA